jgi:hypothetical protein
MPLHNQVMVDREASELLLSLHEISQQPSFSVRRLAFSHTRGIQPPYIGRLARKRSLPTIFGPHLFHQTGSVFKGQIRGLSNTFQQEEAPKAPSSIPIGFVGRTHS